MTDGAYAIPSLNVIMRTARLTTRAGSRERKCFMEVSVKITHNQMPRTVVNLFQLLHMCAHGTDLLHEKDIALLAMARIGEIYGVKNAAI